MPSEVEEKSKKDDLEEDKNDLNNNAYSELFPNEIKVSFKVKSDK